jgi:hypothetical protein
MGINTNIASALNKHLSLLTPTTMMIAWENIEIDPSISTPYLRAWLMPGRTTTLTLGNQSWAEFPGVFQIDCLYPANEGWNSATVKADAIYNHFKRGTLATYNDVQVRIKESSVEPGDVDGIFYKKSVSIYYVAYSQS